MSDPSADAMSNPRSPALPMRHAENSPRVLTARDIVTFDDAPPPLGTSPWVAGMKALTDFEVVDPDPAWPHHFTDLVEIITAALGDHVLGLEHVGSTAVPGLAAKPIIDIDLTVANPDAEVDYLPVLERARFVLSIREPWWYGHRCLRYPEPASYVHVFGPDCAESARHRIFRDWLTERPEDRALYASAKASALAATRAVEGHTMDYNAAKQAVIREIYTRAFQAGGLTGPDPPLKP